VTIDATEADTVGGHKTVRVTGGGQISARFVAPAPLGTPPLPREQWPPRESLANLMGWRVSGKHQ
jgi:hypothetical protein